MNKTLLARTALAVSATALLLAACGGGGGGDDTPVVTPSATGSQVPASATSSAAGAFGFVNGLAASKDDSGEPLILGDAVLGTSETDEPSAI